MRTTPERVYENASTLKLPGKIAGKISAHSQMITIENKFKTPLILRSLRAAKSARFYNKNKQHPRPYMKFIKITLALAVLAIGFGAPMANAQQQTSQKNQTRAQVLTKELGLSADQSKQITAIYKDEKSQLDALDKNADKTKRQAIQKASIDKINAVLTPDQQKKFAAYQKADADKKKASQKKAGDTK